MNGGIAVECVVCRRVLARVEWSAEWIGGQLEGQVNHYPDGRTHDIRLVLSHRITTDEKGPAIQHEQSSVGGEVAGWDEIEWAKRWHRTSG